MSDAHLSSESQLTFQVGTLVWVHTDGWAGHLKFPGVLVKINPKRSKVRYEVRGMEHESAVPNRAITKRRANETS